MTDIHRHRTKDGRPRDPLTERRTLYGKALTFPDEQMLITTIVLVTMIERGAYGRRSGDRRVVPVRARQGNAFTLGVQIHCVANAVAL